VLHIGLPLLVGHLPRLYLSHFAAYCLAIRLLHAPKSEREIVFAERLLHIYCKSAPEVFNSSIELLTLHSHLHLPEQVRLHGGLAFTSAFAFESAIRHTKKKAYGTRDLAAQISYWTDLESTIYRSPIAIQEPRAVDEIDFNNRHLNEYRLDIIQSMTNHGHPPEYVKLFKRYKHTFVTFHSYVYDKAMKCVSYIVSYSANGIEDEEQVAYGDCVVFYEYQEEHFVLIRRYSPAPIGERFSSHVDLPIGPNNDIQRALDRTFSMQVVSDSFLIMPVKWIRHKCISVAVRSFVCLSEIRVDFEHD
jgi:hypothetical protein